MTKKNQLKKSIIIIWVKQTNLGDLTVQSFQERITSKSSSKIKLFKPTPSVETISCSLLRIWKEVFNVEFWFSSQKILLFFRLVCYDNNCWNESSWFLSKCLLTGTLPLIKSSKHSHRTYLKLFGVSFWSCLKLLLDHSINCFSIHSSFYLIFQICYGISGGK